MGRGDGSTVDGVRPVGCQERQDVLEACLGAGGTREVRRARHSVTGRGIRLDVAAYKPAVLFDDGCSVVPSGASQY